MTPRSAGQKSAKTQGAFWDARWERPTSQSGRPNRRGLRVVLDEARTRLGALPGHSYQQYRFEQLLGSYLPRRPGLAALEVGCAPGRNLVRLHELFGYEPFGIEYSRPGFELTRTTFTKHGFRLDNVIYGDFFDAAFHRDHRSRFDVVLSRGFIEHFDDPVHVAGLHTRLLRQDGYLVCTVPNLMGAAYPFVRFFVPELLRAHNRGLMKMKRFAAVFKGLPLRQLFCGPIYGLALHGMSYQRERSFRGRAAKLLGRLQDCYDHAAFLLLRGREVPVPLISQFVFIGQRT